MEFVPLDITVVSAEGLKNVNMFTKMDVYVVISISGDHTARQTTPVDKNCGKSPTWNYRIQFTLHHASLANRFLNFTLMSQRALGDRTIGEVSVPIRELLDTNDQRTSDYQVRTVSGKQKGTLKFSYKFGEKFTQQVAAPKTFNEPVMAYPYPPAGGMGYGMPSHSQPQPHPQPYGYPSGGGAYGQYGGYPPQPQGYPPYGGQPMGYGQQVPKKKMGGSKLGLGLGAGLLGGLLVGDMVSDMGDMGGYDGGFDDGGGMDFDF